MRQRHLVGLGLYLRGLGGVSARILLGIHFRLADDVARTQGSGVADWTFVRFLRPIAGGRQ